MTLIFEPSAVPDVRYHTLQVESTDNGDYHIAARNNDVCFSAVVGSVAIGGESVGFNGGAARFESADSWIRLEYVDFIDEYGYEEIQVRFEERQ